MMLGGGWQLMAADDFRRTSFMEASANVWTSQYEASLQSLQWSYDPVYKSLLSFQMTTHMLIHRNKQGSSYF